MAYKTQMMGARCQVSFTPPGLQLTLTLPNTRKPHFRGLRLRRRGARSAFDPNPRGGAGGLGLIMDFLGRVSLTARLPLLACQGALNTTACRQVGCIQYI